MTYNYPGPYELRWYLNTNGIGTSFRQSVRCSTDPALGDPFTTISLSTKGGGTILASDWCTSFGTLLAPFYNNSGYTIDYVELWKYVEGTFDATYYSTYALGIAGTSPAVVEPASQAVFTFRTVGGGIAKLSLLRTVFASGFKIPYASMAAQSKAVCDALTGTGSPVIGRDGNALHIALAVFPGQNEALFKRIYRS